MQQINKHQTIFILNFDKFNENHNFWNFKEKWTKCSDLEYWTDWFYDWMVSMAIVNWILIEMKFNTNANALNRKMSM